MPLILGGSSATATYTVDNSCLFNPGDDPTLTIASLGTPTDQNKWTFSAWVKRGRVASDNGIMRMYADDNDYTTVNVSNAGALEFDNKVSSSFDGRRMPSAVYLDPAAWYHYVMVYDSDNVTGDDRMIIYVNGTRITALDTDSDPGSGTQSGLGSGNTMTIGIGGASGTAEWGGYLAEVALCDGQAYAASDFGEFDSDSPTIWKPKAISGLTFGNNGFYLDFKDSADLGADVSGKSNDFTVANLAAIDQGIDSPTNNFCVMNPIVGTRSGFTWSYGNTKLVTGNNDGSGSTMGISKGKWYYEILIDDLGNFYGGWQDLSNIEADFAEFVPAGAIAMNNSPDLYYNGSGTAQSTGFDPVSSFTTGDYIGLAFDHDNLSLWWSTNGQWYTSDNATASTLTRAQVSANTNGFDCTTASTMSSSSVVAPFMGCSTNPTTNSYNFGNGRFGGTALTGDTYTDDNGQGIFKYEPPDGFRALCTKNLAEYG